MTDARLVPTCQEALRQLVDVVLNTPHIGIEEVARHQNSVLGSTWQIWRTELNVVSIHLENHDVGIDIPCISV